jgi:hypothetical protein
MSRLISDKLRDVEMSRTKAYYEFKLNQREEILKKLEDAFGLGYSVNEDYIHLRDEENGIESIGLSLEKEIIKVRVVITEDSLLEKFNSVLGEPTKIKSRRRKHD